MIKYREITKARKALSLTQQELADKVHITQSAVNKIEHGHIEPSIKTLKRIAKVLGLDYKELL